MKDIVLTTNEENNGKLLATKGPMKIDSLPSDEIKGLVNQELAIVDEDNIALTAKGMEYFKEDEVDANAEADVSNTEAESEEKLKEPNQKTQAESVETQEEGNDENAQEAALEAARVHLKTGRDLALMDTRNVAQESMSSVLNKVMPDIVSGFSAFVNAIRIKDPALTLKVKPSDFNKTISRTSYVNMSTLPLPVPEGLKAKYLTYLDTLESAVARAEHVPSLIKEFTSYAADVITNDDTKLDTRSKEGFYKELQNSREGTYAMIGACFQPGFKAKLNYGFLVERNADWNTVTNKAMDLANRINRIDRNDLLKKSKHLKDLLIKIRDNSARGGFDAASPETIRMLADGSYQIASELEFYSVVYYRMTTLINCINQDMDAIINASSI